MILCLAYVVDNGLKAFLVVDIECTSTLSPPFLANRRGRAIMCGEWTETFLLQRLEPAGAPGFELLPDLLGFAVARHDDVHMVRAAIDGVRESTPAPGNDRQWSIRRAGTGPGREGRHLPSGGPALRCCERDREVANRGGTRPTRAHRRAARCRTLARSENRPPVRAKAVRNHVSLCFSSVSLRPWSIDVPSHNVTHQPDTPATGPSACNPACSGLSNLTYLPTRRRETRGTPLARA